MSRPGLTPAFQIHDSRETPSTLTANLLERLTYSRHIDALTRRWLRRLLAGTLEAA